MTKVLKFKRKTMATPTPSHHLDICVRAATLKQETDDLINMLLKKQVNKEIVQPFFDFSHNIMGFLREIKTPVAPEKYS